MTLNSAPRARAYRLAALALLGWVGLCLALVLPLRFFAPATTAFMLESDVRPVDYRWVGWRHIAPAAALAVVASEDQKFPDHHGFDFEAMDQALEHNAHSRHIRGGSTISQQTAKNLFLWSGRSYLRKALEAWFTVLLESCWSKRRILETYLNIAQFGPDVFGVEAASQRYYHHSAAHLDVHEAALLAAVLPNPVRLHVDRPSRYLLARTADIEEQMRLLGPDYLRALR